MVKSKRSGIRKTSAFKDIEMSLLPCKKIRVMAMMSGPWGKVVPNSPVYVIGPPEALEVIEGLLKKASVG
jgi:hypothetical protein